MLRYFAAHATAANILMLVILLLGAAALPNLNRETFPEIKTDKVSVTVVYPGASPLEVEKAICNRLEDATDGISFLSEQLCEARDNTGLLTLTMQENGNINRFLDDVKSAVDSISDFPSDAEQPVVEIMGRTRPVVSVAVSANLTQPELKALSEYYREQLLALNDVPIVKISGFSKHELSVLIKVDTLRQFKLSIQDIANLIRSQAVDLPLGTLKADRSYYQLRFDNERNTAKSLADLVIINNDKGGQIRLGDIAIIQDKFSDEEKQVIVNGKPAGLLQISKNIADDTLSVFNAVKQFVDQENARLPASTRLVITQDSASIVSDRLNLLIKNGWQGLLLASLTLFLFFVWRYTFWVALGLPISFIGGLLVMSGLDISINMISMVALLMAIGILMDDAIVISESIEHEHRKGKPPLEAVVLGTRRVMRGVLSSFITSAVLFGSLLFLKGEMGQILSVIPLVLLSVLTISLVEAFLILPHHLKHSLEHKQNTAPAAWRKHFENGFDNVREQFGKLAEWAIRFRYSVVALVFALLIITLSLFPAGVIKFKPFPDIEGNILEARILMPQGTPFTRTKTVVNTLLQSLDQVIAKLPPETHGKLVRNIQVAYSTNADAGEEGAHLATISLDLLAAEKRITSLMQLKRLWQQNTGDIADALSIQFKEPRLGPAGKAISIRLQGNDLEKLSKASWELQTWLKGYRGVSNILDDLRPGKPQFNIRLQAGSLQTEVDSKTIAEQLRAAYQGIKVNDVYYGREAYEINVKLDSQQNMALQEFKNFPIISKQGKSIPLEAIAEIEAKREYSRITRINHQRTVTVSADVDSKLANTQTVLADTKTDFLPQLERKYPGLHINLEGEVKNTAETNRSIITGFLLGITGIFLLLSFQFGNYKEPLVVLINIPLALIGVVWGHLLMGLNMSLPSVIGFVSLAGVVVNDSILLVEFVKLRNKEGLSLHEAASQAVRDRFRAIFLTSITTIAGTIPLLSETSLQAQVLVPLIASVVFGMLASTLLILLILPAAYSIFEDYGLTKLDKN